MGDDQLVVYFDALQDAERAMQKTLQAVDQILDDRDHYAKTLMATWWGEAAEAYRQRHQEWVEALRDLHDRLGDLHQLVITAHGNHADAVHVNTATWRV